MSGYTAFQRPFVPGHQGGRTTCFITCGREGFTTADEYDEIEARFIAGVKCLFGSDCRTPVVINPIRPTSSVDWEEIIVAPRDTLSGLAKNHYGSFEYWPLLWDANRATIGPNPNLLIPGQRLKVPYFSGFTLAQLVEATRRAPTWRNYH